MKTLKQRIHSGEIVHGCWINLGSSVSAEIVGSAGFDWVLIDLEHGAGDLSAMYHQLQVLKGTGATAIVRTDEPGRSKVQRILDAGATGIMFPQFRDSEETERAVRSMYYPPFGARGMARQTRATAFGTFAEQYMSGLDNTLISVIQIETVDAVNNVDAIASTEKVDVLFIGPNDLSLALGVYGNYSHPSYQDAIQKVAEAAKRHGKVAGVLLQNTSEYKMYSKLGYTFLACGSDGGFVTRAARQMVEDLNKLRSQ